MMSSVHDTFHESKDFLSNFHLLKQTILTVINYLLLLIILIIDRFPMIDFH